MNIEEFTPLQTNIIGAWGHLKEAMFVLEKKFQPYFPTIIEVIAEQYEIVVIYATTGEKIGTIDDVFHSLSRDPAFYLRKKGNLQ